jgi:hypothetical protein
MSKKRAFADLDDGDRVAFDLIDERSHLDLDAEGLRLSAGSRESYCANEGG